MRHWNVTAVLAALLSTQPLAGQYPQGRIYHSMVATESNGAIFVFGGVTEHGWEMDLLDVWALDVSSMTWEAAGVLEPADSYSAALDTQSDRVIVFSLTGETWAFAPGTGEWERMSPATSPSGRCGQRTVYDRAADRVILFGGFVCTAVEDPMQNDTWAYDYESDSWQEMRPATAPPERMYHAMAYDPIAERSVVWGGRVEDSAVWSYDYESDNWTRHEAQGGPSGIRSYHSLTYVPTLEAMVVFGGLALDAPLSFDGTLQNDTWILDLDGSGWRKVPTGGAPPPRSHHAAAFGPSIGQVVVFGGEVEASYSGVMTDEVWTFDPEGEIWVRGKTR
jgi:Galactose oxidase, central domain